MTKLFSIKSLACAGAAAFALTLTAAPQVSADDVSALTPEVLYEEGVIHIKTTGSDNIISTDDGKALYYGTGKNESSIKKYTILADSDATGDGSVTLTYDISGLLGKECTIKFAVNDPNVDSSAKTTKVDLAASPKLKAKLEGDDVKVTVGTSAVDKTLGSGQSGYVFRYRVGTYGEWSDPIYPGNAEDDNGASAIQDDIERSRQLGTTLYVQVAEVDKEGLMASPWSKEAKVKVAAKGKAPKVSFKTVLTKGFEWKMGDKVEYIVTLGEGEASKKSLWTAGSKEKADWEKIISSAAATKDGNTTGTIDSATVKDYVKGDAISTKLQIQVRTKADDKKGKPASAIKVVDLIKSPNSPNNDVIKVKMVNNTKKGATTSCASIAPGTSTDKYEGQYSTDGKKWKKLSKEVIFNYDKLSSGKIYLREVGKDAKVTLLPSAVTEVTVPSDGTKDEEGTKGLITATAYEVASDATTWREVKYSDYENKTPQSAD